MTMTSFVLSLNFRFDIVGIDEALVVERHPVHLDAVELALMMKGPQHRVVLDGRRDGVVAFLEHPPMMRFKASVEL